MKPYQQGQLDMLCGLYAVINASCMMMKQIRPLSPNDCQDIFIELVNMLVMEGLLESAITEGTTQQTMSRMLKTADVWLSLHRGVHLSYKKPFHNDSTVPTEKMKATLVDHLTKQKSSAIICLTGIIDHWTTIQEVQKKRMILIDSNGRRVINSSTCLSPTAYQQRQSFAAISTSLYVVNCT